MLAAISGVRITLAGLRRALPWFIAAAALAFAAWQQVRITGFGFDVPLIGRIGITGYAERERTLTDEIKAFVALQRQAERDALVAKQTAEAIYAGVAERIDDNAQVQLGAARAAADRYIGAHRVRCPAGAPGAALAPAADPGAGGAAGASAMPELDGILVSERDIRICTDNTVKAIAGHKLATELERASTPADQP